MLLKDKTAIIYGGGGAVGGAVAKLSPGKEHTYSLPVGPQESSRQLLRKSMPTGARLRWQE